MANKSAGGNARTKTRERDNTSGASRASRSRSFNPVEQAVNRIRNFLRSNNNV